ncbi:hypothetical protein O181_118049, partial [Austropuccinia psidii MF-1]|nr:hypothetical protein [Austropuccinia psidii MF-1]
SNQAYSHQSQQHHHHHQPSLHHQQTHKPSTQQNSSINSSHNQNQILNSTSNPNIKRKHQIQIFRLLSIEHTIVNLLLIYVHMIKLLRSVTTLGPSSNNFNAGESANLATGAKPKVLELAHRQLVSTALDIFGGPPKSDDLSILINDDNSCRWRLFFGGIFVLFSLIALGLSMMEFVSSHGALTMSF